MVVEQVDYQPEAQVQTQTMPQQGHQAHWVKTVQDITETVVAPVQVAVVKMAEKAAQETKETLVLSEAGQDQIQCRHQDQRTMDQVSHQEVQQVAITQRA